MEFPKWKKTFKSVFGSFERLSGLTKNITLSASLLALHSGQSNASPPVPINDAAVLSIPVTEVRKYSFKYLLKSAANSRFATRLVQGHRSHSSHSSHRSHSSHASHYSSSGSIPAPKSAPVPDTSMSTPRPIARPNPPTGFSDSLADDTRSRSFWSIGAPSVDEGSRDQLVAVSHRAGRLEIAPRSGMLGRHYNGYFSTSHWSILDAHADIGIAQTPSIGSSMIFALTLDSDNWYGFVLEDGTLYFQSKVSGIKSPKFIKYNAAEHRFWRFRHDASSNLLFWETSRDGITWLVRNAEAPQISLSEVYITLAAGTSKVVKQAGIAAFSNFRLTRND